MIVYLITQILIVCQQILATVPLQRIHAVGNFLVLFYNIKPHIDIFWIISLLPVWIISHVPFLTVASLCHSPIKLWLKLFHFLITDLTPRDIQCIFSHPFLLACMFLLLFSELLVVLVFPHGLFSAAVLTHQILDLTDRGIYNHQTLHTTPFNYLFYIMTTNQLAVPVIILVSHI